MATIFSWLKKKKESTKITRVQYGEIETVMGLATC